MLSVYLKEPMNISILESAPPVPTPGQALLKIRAAGICGSDVGAYRGSNPLVSYPRILGHELAGEVLSVPENCHSIEVGDHVVVDPYLYCGNCYPCSLGRTNCCENLKVLGVHVDGGMAQLFAHPCHMLVKAPKTIPWELLALAEPLTIALHGLHRARLAPGEYIAISGAGSIGILAALAAKAYGATPILIDPLPQRLQAAQALGIQCLAQPGETLRGDLATLARGNPIAAVMEASGSHSAIISALDIVSHAGRVVLTGWPAGETCLDTALITRKELDILGARTSAGEFEEALELIASEKVDVKGVLSATLPFKELPQAIESLHSNPGSALKIVGIF